MTIAFLIRCVIGVAVGLFMAPVVLFCLWPRALRSWFESGPDGIDAVASPAVRDVVAALRELGFEALGVKVEKAPLRAVIQELAFVAGDRRYYASVGNLRRRARLYYYTPLPTGGLVLTSNGAFPKIESPTVTQKSYPESGARELLELHHEALRSLEQRGEVIPTQAARLEATYAYYNHPEVRATLRRAGVTWLGLVAILEWLLVRR